MKENVFGWRDLAAISSIPIALRCSIDAVVWHYSNYGDYSVKSAYIEYMKLLDSHNRWYVDGHWKALWNLDLPLKVKNFMWRVCRNCLPTRSNLCNEDLHMTGVGLVLRDSNGTFITGAARSVEGLFDASEAEIWGLREALIWVKQTGYRNVIFEMDCQVVVHAIQEKKVDLDEFGGSMTTDCLHLLSSAPSFSVAFVKRQANIMAHTLAIQFVL